MKNFYKNFKNGNKKNVRSQNSKKEHSNIVHKSAGFIATTENCHFGKELNVSDAKYVWCIGGYIPHELLSFPIY